MFLAALAPSAMACETLPVASELTRPTILAVRADPPVIDAGERAALDVLIAGPDGTIDDAALQWSIVSAFEELPIIGSIERDESGSAVYVAPSVVDEPTGTAIEVIADVGDGAPLEAIKTIVVGFSFAVPNPRVTGLSIDGIALAENDVIALSPGEIRALDVTVAPAPTDESDFAWLTTLGTIDRYRRSPSEYIAPDHPGRGQLYVVYRDADGGVAWRSHAIVVE